MRAQLLLILLLCWMLFAGAPRASRAAIEFSLDGEYASEEDPVEVVEEESGSADSPMLLMPIDSANPNDAAPGTGGFLTFQTFPKTGSPRVLGAYPAGMTGGGGMGGGGGGGGGRSGLNAAAAFTQVVQSLPDGGGASPLSTKFPGLGPSSSNGPAGPLTFISQTSPSSPSGFKPLADVSVLETELVENEVPERINDEAPAGGAIPEPSSVIAWTLLAGLGLGTFWLRRR